MARDNSDEWVMPGPLDHFSPVPLVSERELVAIAPSYGSPGCECGPQATPYAKCPVHWALALAERLLRAQNGADARPAIGQRWTHIRNLPHGSPEQVTAWLTAAKTPKVVVVIGASETYVQYVWWSATGRSDLVPVDQEGHPVTVPDGDTVWASGNKGAEFGLNIPAFMELFTKIS